MKIGIDGNMWYCSNGLCLGDSRAQFTFSRTLREAAEKFNAEFDRCTEVPKDLVQFLDMPPEEYKERNALTDSFWRG